MPTSRPPLNGRTRCEIDGVSASLIPAAAPASVSSTRQIKSGYIPINLHCSGSPARSAIPLRATFKSLMRSPLLLLLFCIPLFCQNNYEIQVYPYETVAPHQTMIELHSNFTFQGFKTS